MVRFSFAVRRLLRVLASRGIAIGTFDLFHAGHVSFLQQCKEQCHHLTVALNTDHFAARYKRRPVLALHERRVTVEGCKHVDQVLVNAYDEDSRWAILKAEAELVLHGDDWAGESLLKQLGVNEEWLEVHGVRLGYVPYSPMISSSEIISRIRKRNDL